MKKLLQGVLNFKNNIRPEYVETFSHLALGQKPDALLVACSDSRVAPNVFASTDPGDLFVLRNIGNIIPPFSSSIVDSADYSASAAVEFAVSQLNVKDIIICGHSECGAMHAVADGLDQVTWPHLRSWLAFASTNVLMRQPQLTFDANLSQVNRLSQLNVLSQIANLRTFPLVQEKIAKGALRIHGWWFDIAHADVRIFNPNQRRFVEIDEDLVNDLLKLFG